MSSDSSREKKGIDRFVTFLCCLGKVTQIICLEKRKSELLKNLYENLF